MHQLMFYKNSFINTYNNIAKSVNNSLKMFSYSKQNMHGIF